MPRQCLLCLPLLLCTAGASRAAAIDTPSQTPRQAVIEMFSGGEDKFRRHLTVEVQEKLRDLLNNPTGISSPFQAFTSASNAQKIDTFESGRILFAFNNAQQHQRLEIHIDGDDWRGSDDTMELSVHSFREGIEEDLPLGLKFQLGLKLQDSVWRLNALTVSVNLPVGDPRILDKTWWMPQMLANATTSAPQVQSSNEQARLSPMRAVHRISLAEDLYAQRHPEVGFTCALPNLVNVGKGLDEGGPYRFLDPEFAGGVYNGYKFFIKGCAGKPAKSFQVMAEPVNGQGKAYCADDRKVVRYSDDGRATSCLTTGRVARQ
jgi:hypothetical protein